MTAQSARERTLAPATRSDVAAALAVFGMVVSLGLTVVSEYRLATGPSGLLTMASALCAVAGSYLSLVLLALAARIPALESALGQDRLIAVHRQVGPWAVYLVAAHVVLITASRSLDAARNAFAELWTMITTEPWILAATVGVLLMCAVGVSSWWRVRSRMARGSWWTLHLYAYLAIALAFAHQIVSGGPFIQGWGRVWWVALYVLAFGAILVWRVLAPVVRSLRHDLRVARVVREGQGVSSVWISGSHLDRWGTRPGQFLTLRFVSAGLLWEGHPYSLSAPVRDGMLRITVKALGDASTRTQAVEVGTRVLVAGPYGVMTADRCVGDHAVLVGAGIGVAPLRAIAEGLVARRKRVDLLLRSHSDRDVLFREELTDLASLPGVRVHLLVGPRRLQPLDAAHLRSRVPDIATADFFACGPEPLLERLETEAHRLGIPPQRTHIERFAL